jgi:hypothetical protein
MKKVSLVAGLGIGLGLTLLVSPMVQAGVLPPAQEVAGRTQAEWSAAWWQTMLAIPASQNPITDASGAFAHLGDQGPVFFLAGSFSSAPVVRDVTVRSDQYLFFPLLNTISFAQISAYGGTEAGLRRDAAETAGIDPNGQASNTTLFARLNGVDLALPPPTTSLLGFRQVSPPGLFTVNLPADNFLGLPAGPYPSVSDGWWLTLGPLDSGSYQLHFGGATEGIGAYAGSSFSQDITYNLNVVPEPSGWVLLGSAGLALVGPCLRRVGGSPPRGRA